MIILAIDPGTTQSAWLAFDTTTGRPMSGSARCAPNAVARDVCRVIRGGQIGAVVIEQVASYGMAVGAEVFETIHWAGRFAEAAFPIPVYRIPRKAVTLNLCGSARAKDANVRRALLDRFGGEAAVGRKAAPGPLHSIHGDLWAALGVAVTWADMSPEEREKARLP